MPYNLEPFPVMKEIEDGAPFEPDSTFNRDTIKIDTASWSHVCSARFGLGRPCAEPRNSHWTGDSYRYDIFLRVSSHYSKDEYALRWQHGGGTGWLLEKVPSGMVASTLSFIASNPAEERRWDFCHFLAEAIAATRRSAAQLENERMSQAFLEKRLKRRKSNHRVYLEVIEKPTTLGAV